MINCHVNVLTIDLIDLIRPLKAKYVKKSIRLFYMIGIIESSRVLNWKMFIMRSMLGDFSA